MRISPPPPLPPPSTKAGCLDRSPPRALGRRPRSARWVGNSVGVAALCSCTALVEALRRVAEVRALGVSDLDLSSIPAGHIRTLARYAATTWASVIARMPAARRTATLVAFARVFDATAQDDALDVLDLMIGTLLARVEHECDQARLRTLRDLHAAQNVV